MKWMPIETAPKDGSHFIAWDSVYFRLLFTMHWDTDALMTDYERWSGHVSHWMPLPEPPEVEQ